MIGELLIKGGHIIDPSQELDQRADLLISKGRIVKLAQNLDVPPGAGIIDARGLVVSPGFVDLHSHLRTPGFEEKEDISSGTRAAAKGGFTTVLAMPNTDPPLDNISTITLLKELVEREGVIRVLPVGCITRGRKGAEIVSMGELFRVGVVALSDDGSSVGDASVMYQAMSYSLAFNLILIEHCEEPALAADGQINEGIVATRLGLRGIPAVAEDIIVARDVLLAGTTGARIHIAHVSTATSVEIIRQAKKKGVKVTAEVTPHHLTITEEALLGYNTLAKVKPPLRREEDRQALIQGVADGTIDVIATDHSPHTDTEKMVEFDKAPFGISGFETALAMLLDIVRDGHLSLYQLISLITEKPARIIGKYNLGTLAGGSPAEITIFDPEKEWMVSKNSLISKGKNTPIIGQVLRGKVMATIFGDEFAYLDEATRIEHV